MRQLPAFKILVLLVVVALLSARIGNVSHRIFVQPLQNFLSNKDQITGEGVKKSPRFCKTKTLPDIHPPAEGLVFVPPPPSPRSLLHSPVRGTVPEEVEQEIFIPPERMAYLT